MARFDWGARIATAAALPFFLAACSSLGGPSPAGPALNLAGLDLSSALFALDLPLSVESLAGPRIAYGTTLDVVLVPADAEQVMGVLPSPAEGRSYAVYAFAPSDHGTVRAAQAVPPAGEGSALAVTPRLCATLDARKDRDTIAVLAIVPEQRPVTVAGPETIAAFEARTGAPLPACAGHSG